MKNIKTIDLEKYADGTKFEFIGNGIYKELQSGSYKIALSFELEQGEDDQYPIEDVLDTYYVNATDFIELKEEDGARVLSIELEGSLDDNDRNLKNIMEISKMVGKRVYNKKDAQGRVQLTVE